MAGFTVGLGLLLIFAGIALGWAGRLRYAIAKTHDNESAKKRAAMLRRVGLVMFIIGLLILFFIFLRM